VTISTEVINMRRILLVLFSCIYAINLQAKVELPSFISSGMVLQQKSTVSIWGKSAKAKAVTLRTSWSRKIYTVKSNEAGEWDISIQTPKAGGPYQILLNDGDETILDDVLIGEVWIASGQSNMEMPLKGFSNQKIKGGEELINNAANKKIRLFKSNTTSKGLPQKDIAGKWQHASPQSATNFSAVAYYFAYQLEKELKVPIGIIQVAWGGTAIQGWMSRESLQPFSAVNLPAEEDKTFSNKNTPVGLFNAMINPIIPYKAKGCIWYQGEHNVKEPSLYAKLFPAMVKDWRRRWQNENMTFIYAQIAPWDYKSANWKAPYLREAQLNALKEIPNSGMAVLLDIGEEKDIHPAAKKPVAERFFKLAMAKAYGKKISYSGPLYKRMEIQAEKIKLYFDYAEGLYFKGSISENFEIAGADKTFYPAKARIEKGNILTVYSEQVKEPVSVRYAFKGWVVGDLFNKHNLPASSFRTDDWNY